MSSRNDYWAYLQTDSPYLMHYGVKGMKWGVRKDNYNSSYSAKQRKRDKSVYGNSAVRRINKRMNKGDTISGARSAEATRIHRFRRASTHVGQFGGIAAGVAGAIAGFKMSEKVLRKYGTGDPMTDMLIKSVVATGMYSATKSLGQNGSRSVTMLLGGYDPDKFRYG